MTPDIHDLIERLRKLRVWDDVPSNASLGDLVADHIVALSADLASAKEALDAETEACAQVAYDTLQAWGDYGWKCQAEGIQEAIRARTTLRSLNKEDGR